MKNKQKQLTDKQKHRKEMIRPAFAFFSSGLVCLFISILNLKEIFQSTKLNVIALSLVVLVVKVFFTYETFPKIATTLLSISLFVFGIWIEPFGLGGIVGKELVISQNVSRIISTISCCICAFALLVGFVYFCMACFPSGYCKRCGTELRKIDSQKYGDAKTVDIRTTPTSVNIESISSSRITYSVSGGETERKEVQTYKDTYLCPKCRTVKHSFYNREKKL